jgi:hypothetical protein
MCPLDQTATSPGYPKQKKHRATFSAAKRFPAKPMPGRGSNQSEIQDQSHSRKSSENAGAPGDGLRRTAKLHFATPDQRLTRWGKVPVACGCLRFAPAPGPFFSAVEASNR